MSSSASAVPYKLHSFGKKNARKRAPKDQWRATCRLQEPLAVCGAIRDTFAMLQQDFVRSPIDKASTNLVRHSRKAVRYQAVLRYTIHLEATSQPPLRSASHRYLKADRAFQGLPKVRAMLGISLLFLNARTRWMDALSDWTATKSCWSIAKVSLICSTKLQAVLAGGTLHATGLFGALYAAVLFTEESEFIRNSVAELLMIFATAGLIPLEIRHLWHRPGLAGAVICWRTVSLSGFVSVLKRDKAKAHGAQLRDCGNTLG